MTSPTQDRFALTCGPAGLEELDGGQRRDRERASQVGQRRTTPSCERVPRTPAAFVKVCSAQELVNYTAEWMSLASAAIEPNVFYEPWMLLPAIRLYGAGANLRFALVFTSEGPQGRSRPILSGFFPLQCCSTYCGVPIRSWKLWRHRHCYLGTPLLRSESARDSLQVFLDWLESERRQHMLFEFGRIGGDGPLQRLFIDEITRREWQAFVSESYTRAFLELSSDANAYLAAAVSGKHRKERRRVENRLSEMGSLEYDALSDTGDLNAWLDEFLSLEIAGWKGRLGTALQSRTEDDTFFRQIATQAFHQGRLMMLALRLDGRAIAMKFNLAAGSGAFSIKVAYDEKYSRFSPGVLLEMHNIRRLHNQTTVRWMDSCADPNHPMINGLWTGRKVIQTIVFSPGSRAGIFWVSMLPGLRWVRRRFASTRDSRS